MDSWLKRRRGNKKIKDVCENYMIMKLFFTSIATALLFSTQAQDTLNTGNLKLELKNFKPRKSSYFVYFVDTVGKRLGSGEIWDREVAIDKNTEGQQIYTFKWQAYSRDSLRINTIATGLLPSFTPLTHEADYFKRGKKSFVFTNGVVTVPEKDKKTAKDSTFRVELNIKGYEFPMDLELFGLLPFKKVGQTFMMAFYEPGGKEAKYYKLSVTALEDLNLVGSAKEKCWVLRIDYAPSSYALFWISDKTREVLKMKEQFKSIFRYKVKLY
jgi:hypothetical protein